MSALTLGVGALTALVAGALFAYVGWVVRERGLRPPEQAAMSAFAVWWYGLAGLSVYTAATNLLAMADWLTFAMVLTLLNALIVVLMAALWGLTYYLSFLFTGRTWLKVPLMILYAGWYFWFTYLITAASPQAVEVTQWGTTLKYERELAEVGGAQPFVLLILLPPMLGAMAYFSLFFRVEAAWQRYRIGLVAAGILVWFGVSLVASILSLNDLPWWPMASRLVSVLGAAAVLAAYRPPPSVRRRLGFPPKERGPLPAGPTNASPP